MICSDWLPSRAKQGDKGRLCKMQKQANQREEMGKGRWCLMRPWLSVYYKLKILSSLVCSRHKVGGGVHMYVCCPKPNSWRLEGREKAPRHCGGEQVDKKACGSLYICLSACVLASDTQDICVYDWAYQCIHVHKLQAAVVLVKMPVSLRICVSG